jgi:pilus assembly protein CpaE
MSAQSEAEGDSKMLGAVIISPDQELANELMRVLMASQEVTVLRVLPHFPSNLELQRVIRASAPDVVFLGVEASAAVQEVVQCMEANAPGVQMVAMSRNCTPNLLLELMRSGVREFMPHPFSFSALQDILGRISGKAISHGQVVDATDQFYCFLPAKAGVGCSTVCVNVAYALSHEIKVSTLLSDFDLNSGIVKFMLKLTSEHSVIDAVDRAGDLDENLWPQLISSEGKLDILHAGPMNPGHRLDLQQLRQWLAFVRRHYRVICADLSGNMERYSLELMQEAKKIFLICTPEIPSLHLADEKFRYLQKLDLGDRVQLILNRSQKRSIIGTQEIEQLLGLPITLSLPNDYIGVHRSLTNGGPVSSTSPLGKQFTAMARMLLGEEVAPLKPEAKGFAALFGLNKSAPPKPTPVSEF